MNTSTSVVVFCEDFLRNSKESSGFYQGSDFFSDNVFGPQPQQGYGNESKRKIAKKNPEFSELTNSSAFNSNFTGGDRFNRELDGHMRSLNQTVEHLKIWENLIQIEQEAVMQVRNK